MKLRYITDGTPQGSRLLTESGDLIEGILRAELCQDAENAGMFTISIDARYIEIGHPSILAQIRELDKP